MGHGARPARVEDQSRRILSHRVILSEPFGSAQHRLRESKDLDAVHPALNTGGSSVESGVEILRLRAAPSAQDDTVGGP